MAGAATTTTTASNNIRKQVPAAARRRECRRRSGLEELPASSRGVVVSAFAHSIRIAIGSDRLRPKSHVTSPGSYPACPPANGHVPRTPGASRSLGAKMLPTQHSASQSCPLFSPSIPPSAGPSALTRGREGSASTQDRPNVLVRLHPQDAQDAQDAAGGWGPVQASVNPTLNSSSLQRQARVPTAGEPQSPASEMCFGDAEEGTPQAQAGRAHTEG